VRSGSDRLFTPGLPGPSTRKSSSRWWEIPNRPPALRRREFEALRELARDFERRGSLWRVGAAGFEARVPLREPGPVGAVVYKVHVVGWEDSRARFHASVTVWPRATVARAGSRTRPASRAWCEACRIALARHGYRGEWRRGQWHFGDFWKRLRTLPALRTEIERFEQWAKIPPWSAVEQRRRRHG
jgi:hypothetical protein